MNSKLNNPNHPVKGSSVKVEPIKSLNAIKAIKRLLKETKPRDYCLFILGINTNLRASDLVRIKLNDVISLKTGSDFEIKEKKTNKIRRVTLNKDCIKAIEIWLAERPVDENVYLFSSQRGNTHITSIYVNKLVKQWATKIQLQGNFGAHTLRKSWGYHQRVSFGVGIAELMVCFNHSSQKQTLDYLCIQPEEIKNVFMNVVG